MSCASSIARIEWSANQDQIRPDTFCFLWSHFSADRPATVPRHRFVAAMHRAHFTMTTTAAAAKAVPKFRYLSAWFCPFAHRATLALEHHADRVDYEWVEVRIVLTPSVSTFRLTYLELLTQLLIYRHWDGSSEKMRIM
jgi:hypothetical protein